MEHLYKSVKLKFRPSRSTSDSLHLYSRQVALSAELNCHGFVVHVCMRPHDQFIAYNNVFMQGLKFVHKTINLRI